MTIKNVDLPEFIYRQQELKLINAEIDYLDTELNSVKIANMFFLAITAVMCAAIAWFLYVQT